MLKKKTADKSGQITIFIILGLLLLFVSIFLIQLVTQAKKAQLESGKENVFDKIFQKEAMRIYVEDCLTDELESGLILLGKQGRFWAGQPGGIKSFIHGETGISYAGDQIFYGIIRTKYPAGEENKCPCKEGSPPEFCQYQYPDTAFGFGQVQLKEQTLKEDLERFLINRTIWCVENYTRTNISSKAKIASAKLGMELQIADEGISVKADYPLKMTLGDDEFFQLTTFDFFYPSRFKEFVRAAVTFPMENDQRYVDFNYTHENLILPYFEYGSPTKISDSCIEKEGIITCSQGNFFESYNDLKIKLEKKPLFNGDDLFTFSSDLIGEVIHNQPYSFRIARQNRPPALDYIQRHACPTAGYDYLVVKDDPELGGIDINLSARDPDEDEAEYGFEDLPASGSAGSVWQGFVADNKLNVPSASLSENKYEITAKASDTKLLDWQKVRIFVDKIKPSGLTLSLPSEYGVVQDETNKKYFVSKEDPVLVKFNYPPDSGIDGITQTVSLKFKGGGEINFELDPSKTDNCFNLPGLKTDCSGDFWEQYSPDDILDESPAFDSTGEMELFLNKNYCGFEYPTSEKATVIVKECLPYRNPEHPWPWPYENYKYKINEEGEWEYDKQETFEPFLATHACCLGEIDNPGYWGLAPIGTECFVNPVSGCYGKIDQFTTLYEGYILEEEYRLCDGIRGNTCEGEIRSRLKNDELRCGSYNFFSYSNPPKCLNKIDDKCENQKAFGYINSDGEEGNEGWCYGLMGCSIFCQKPIADKIGIIEKNKYYDLNAMAKEKQFTSESDLGLRCGCNSETINKPCDADFDGTFNGICQGNQCCSQFGLNEPGAEDCAAEGKG